MNKNAQALGRLGGKARSTAKTLAARKNATLGGWPKGRKRKKSAIENLQSEITG
jgi:hypothetical protein